MIEAGDFQIRTDLALETHEHLKKKQHSVRGVRMFEEQRAETKVSTVVIETENAAKQLGRPRGRYVTLENERMTDEDGGYHRKVSAEVARCIRRLLPGGEESKEGDADLEKEPDVSVLIVGLGNREVTPDALGPAVVDHLYITRHIIREYGKYAFGNESTSRVSAIVPGVMAQTGMECVEILRGVVEQTKPEVIVTIDALAARSMRRLGRTIQMTDTGIVPGSGVGNHRNAITRESIGVPVISIGVPTVVDAATIVSDAMSDFIREAFRDENDKLATTEPREMAHKLLSPQLSGMFVTPKDIDETIGKLSYLISEALNIAFLGDWER